ncbi:ATP-binding protein [Nocardioides daphniae]|uniref:ATP-binding protein n=1 Tax=Nocardioides daphniae TaxID=402297 RepID=UPI003B8A753E
MLFAEFFRSTNPDALKRPTGLGLPILRRIVQRHGGRVTVDSELGVGTTIRVLLPAADA